MTYNTGPFRTTAKLAINRICLITKKDDARCDRYAIMLETWLRARHIEVFRNDISPSLDMIIVLGGDGTLLHIAEKAAKNRIPVLGINLGNLGFLTELAEDESLSALEHLLTSEVTIENRLMLKARLIAGERASEYRYALNDIVINKNVHDQLLILPTTADQEYIAAYKADGLIFSTPTGSTAYNLSAGGPLVYPGLATITVTPICPFMLSSRPVILPPDKVIRTTFDATWNSKSAHIIIDGHPSWTIEDKNLLEIEAAEHSLRLIVSTSRDYFTILRNKLRWGSVGK